MSIISSTNTQYANILQGGGDLCDPLEPGAVDLFQRGKLILFDPITHSNQCHLAAYKIATMYAQEQLTPDYLSLTSGQSDREYLSLAFLINSSCIREKRNITNLLHVPNSRASDQFLQRTSKPMGLVVGERINSFIGEKIKVLSTKLGEDPSIGELKGILDSMSPANHFTYPKFAGVILLLKLLQSNPIPFILKVKVVSSEGTNLLRFLVERSEDHPRPLLESDVERMGKSPVLAIEALASLERPVGEIMEERSSCAHSLFHSSKFKQHKENDMCRCCRPNNMPECESVREVCQRISELPFQELFKAAGAVFTNDCQPECKDALLTPFLREEFARSLQLASDYQISITGKPSIFMVEHMYADLGRFACSPVRLVDSKPQEALNMRGL